MSDPKLGGPTAGARKLNKATVAPAEIQAFMVDVFQTIDEWINAIEELAPQQAINGDNITVGDLITNSVGLTRAELDEVIQVSYLKEKHYKHVKYRTLAI